MSGNSEKAGAKLSPQASLWLAVAAAITGFAVVYGTLGGSDNAGGVKSAASTVASSSATTTEKSAAVTAPATEDLSGKLAAFVRKNPAEPLPAVSFVDAEGKPRSLADFKGKTVLLNLWATWCAPCREEMPSLDRLQKAMGSDTFEVVALAVDRGGPDGAAKFLKSINVETLKVYADATTKSGTVLRVLGMPTTILINKDGNEAGRISGPAAWDGDDAKKLIAEVAK